MLRVVTMILTRILAQVYTDDRISVVDDGRELVVRSLTQADRGE